MSRAKRCHLNGPAHQERSPYGELRAQDHPILGSYHFWMIVARPALCRQAKVEVLCDGDLHSKLFLIPVAPKGRELEERKSFQIVS